ncbi:hypothetical protein EG329_005572 [Mollisiaceae sp. DMI_Dod_QoI]|nr:hypothetical protein EG329_005572 [Helotiales sp. DMI_Dod_QoI]
MPIFGNRHGKSEQWHRDIDRHTRTAGGCRDLRGYKPENRPWVQMRQSTDLYLAKKKYPKYLKSCDERLTNLIIAHLRKDIAILACGHVMTARALEKLLLSRTLTDQSSIEDLKDFLRCIHAISLVGQVVDSEEGNEALRLLETDALNDLLLSRALANLSSIDHLKESLRHSRAASLVSGIVDEIVSPKEGHKTITVVEAEIKTGPAYFVALLEDLLPIRSHPSPSFEHMYGELITQLASLDLELRKMKTERRWSEAYTSVQWLSSFANAPDKSSEAYREVKALLNKGLSRWLVWASWRPNAARIATWRKLDGQKRSLLGPILDLDGPDFEYLLETHGKSLGNHLELDGIPLRLHGSTVDECRDMAERVLGLLDNIVTNREEDMALFVHYMTGPNIIKRDLELLEKLTCGEFGSISITLGEAYSLPGVNPSMQPDAVKRLLRLLKSAKFHSLRDILAVEFAALVVKLIRDECEHLMEGFSGNIWTHEISFARYNSLHSDLQNASWLWPFLEPSLPNLMKDWPSTDELKTLRSIWVRSGAVPESFKSTAQDLIRCYVLKNSSLDLEIGALTKALIRLWRTVHDADRRSVALSLLIGAGSITQVRCSCMEQLPSLSDSFVQSYWYIICRYDVHPEESCIAMAKILAAASLSVDMTSWRPVLHRMLIQQGDRLFEYGLKQSVQEWISFLEDLECLYGHLSTWDPAFSPAVLKPGLLEWARKLRPYSNIINPLKEKLDSFEPLRCLCFEVVGKQDIEEAVENILNVLKQRPWKAEGDDSLVRVTILNELSWNGRNAREVGNALSDLNGLSIIGFGVCLRIQSLLDTTSSHYVPRTFLGAWLSDLTITIHDRKALKSIFKSIDSPSDPPKGWLNDKGLALAADYLDSEYVDLLDEARRLAALRSSLKGFDLQGITELLASIDIEDCTLVEDALASLPAEVVNAVEIIGDKEVEILFSLTHFTQLQRTAMGIGSAQSMVVLLELCDHKKKINRFCIHLDTESKTDNNIRTLNSLYDQSDNGVPWIDTCRLGGKQQTPPFCLLDANPFKYHFSAMLRRQLTGSNFGKDFTTLSEVYSHISSCLKDIGKSCSNCGTVYPVNLRRPMPCTSEVCSGVLQSTDVRVRFSDLIQDPVATDFLISTVYAAASTGNLALLPNTPINETTTIISLLDRLPSITSLAQDPDKLGQKLTSVGQPTLTLLTYLLTSHRSFLVSVSGHDALRVPSMPPGTLQFVLANTSPEQETTFAAALTSPSETRILFHGTSPDRLFAILNQGLKVLSDTPLQAHGAVSGQGIYMADEPSTAYTYCSSTLDKTWKNSSLAEEMKKVNGYKVMLGCEQAVTSLADGNGRIHVVREERMLVVRVRRTSYLSLFFKAPARGACQKRHAEYIKKKSPPRLNCRSLQLHGARNSQGTLRHLCQDASRLQYEPLRPSYTTQPLIRLLELLPGHGTHPVAAVLKNVPLSDNGPYEAVSYCWGDPQDTSTITCNGQPLQVPRRLEIALKDMRYSDKPRALWADAICINQNDVSERESQVQLMRRIFSNAQRTLVWLGGEDEKRQQKMSWFASSTIKLGVTMFRRRVNLASSPQVRVWDMSGRSPRIIAPFSTEFYHELIGMLQMPWFQRAWVVQEVAVSSKATIFWGESHYDWDDVIQALKFMSKANFPLAFIVTLENISAIEKERRCYREGDNKLIAVLLRHQRCTATDPRDKIYSFCGLVESSSKRQPLVRITYEDDATVIYREVALQILEQDRSLNLLSRRPSSTNSVVKHLPSWVPDWSTSSNSLLTYAWGQSPISLAGTELAGADEKLRFCAAGNSIHTPKRSNQDGILEIEGYEFDKITEVGPVFEGVQIPHTVQSFPGIVREWINCIRTLLRARKVFTRWQRVANVRSSSPYITGETMREAFLQTVSVAEFHDSELVKLELELWERGAKFLFGVPYSALVVVWHFLTNRPFLLFEIQGRYALQRRVVRTKSGYLGLASRATEAGDLVVLCKGSSVPLIFRRSKEGEDLFRLVGDAYVHGIMKAEVFQSERCRRMLIH